MKKELNPVSTIHVMRVHRITKRGCRIELYTTHASPEITHARNANRGNMLILPEYWLEYSIRSKRVSIDSSSLPYPSTTCFASGPIPCSIDEASAAMSINKRMR